METDYDKKIEELQEKLKTETSASMKRVSDLKAEIRELHRLQRAEWNRRDAELTEKKKAELAKQYGVEGNPKLDLLWSIAYEHGHSGGLDEVANYFTDLVELIK